MSLIHYNDALSCSIRFYGHMEIPDNYKHLTIEQINDYLRYRLFHDYFSTTDGSRRILLISLGKARSI